MKVSDASSPPSLRPGSSTTRCCCSRRTTATCWGSTATSGRWWPTRSPCGCRCWCGVPGSPPGPCGDTGHHGRPGTHHPRCRRRRAGADGRRPLPAVVGPHGDDGRADDGHDPHPGGDRPREPGQLVDVPGGPHQAVDVHTMADAGPRTRVRRALRPQERPLPAAQPRWPPTFRRGREGAVATSAAAPEVCRRGPVLHRVRTSAPSASLRSMVRSRPRSPRKAWSWLATTSAPR